MQTGRRQDIDGIAGPVLYRPGHHTAAGGEWHTLFIPSCFLTAALLVFCFCLIRGYKVPSPGLAGWLAVGLGGGYFFLRAWFSPWFYESMADLTLIVTALVMFMAGACAGAGNGAKAPSRRWRQSWAC